MQDARNIVETGEKLKVQTQELKRLRAEVRAARSWSVRAKKCNTEQGSIHVDEAKKLVEEHQKLLIEMPDDLEILKQATIGYCICRRPYDGFMIGCDHCEVSFSGYNFLSYTRHSFTNLHVISQTKGMVPWFLYWYF